MSISTYLKELAQGAGASLSRERARQLMEQVLDGGCSDLELGALVMAMHLRGASLQEMAGFLDAIQPRLVRLPSGERPTVVLPSYGGGVRWPPFTPLLALILMRRGLPVLLHGTGGDERSVSAQRVLAAFGLSAHNPSRPVDNGQIACVATSALHPGLARVLEARRSTGVRTLAHTLVQIISPVDGPHLIVACYEHAGDAQAMSILLQKTGAHAMLLPASEGEPVAAPQHLGRIEGFAQGQMQLLQAESDTLLPLLPELPPVPDVMASAEYTLAVMNAELPVPEPLARQADLIMRMCKNIEAENDASHLQRLAV